MRWDWALFAESLGLILAKLPLTLTIVCAAMTLALTLGLLVAFLVRSPQRIVRAPVSIASEFIRRTPLLIQVYFIFYVLPDVGITLSGEVAGVLALGLYQAAYVSLIFGAGIANVPRGQWEAARALQIPVAATWREIILPQAIPPMLPPLGNQALILLKETALLSTITVVEMMGTARIIGNDYYRFLEPITAVGCIYLCICWPVAVGLRAFEQHAARR
jgi:polar amino acid transport system permease protein